jgi:hypothetical protein
MPEEKLGKTKAESTGKQEGELHGQRLTPVNTPDSHIVEVSRKSISYLSLGIIIFM